jgi:hypothetical protein
MSGMGEITFEYDPIEKKEILGEGATSGWVYVHSGVGPALAMSVVAFTDGEGHGFIELAGEWQDVTVVDG